MWKVIKGYHLSKAPDGQIVTKNWKKVDNVGPALRAARQKAKKTLLESALSLGFSERHLRRLEQGAQDVDAATVLRASEFYHAPHLTVQFCRHFCAIGAKYCFEPLNAVDTSPVAILAKYRDEMGEVDGLLDALVGAVLNRKNGNEMTPAQKATFEQAFQELLDVEHVIEVLKIDVPGAIRQHNQKCWDQGYVRRSMEVAA